MLLFLQWKIDLKLNGRITTLYCWRDFGVEKYIFIREVDKFMTVFSALGNQGHCKMQKLAFNIWIFEASRAWKLILFSPNI